MVKEGRKWLMINKSEAEKTKCVGKKSLYWWSDKKIRLSGYCRNSLQTKRKLNICVVSRLADRLSAALKLTINLSESQSSQQKSIISTKVNHLNESQSSQPLSL